VTFTRPHPCRYHDVCVCARAIKNPCISGVSNIAHSPHLADIRRNWHPSCDIAGGLPGFIGPFPSTSLDESRFASFKDASTHMQLFKYLLQSARESPPPPLLQNWTCDFHRIRLLSQRAFAIGTSCLAWNMYLLCHSHSLTSTTQLVGESPPLCRRTRLSYSWRIRM